MLRTCSLSHPSVVVASSVSIYMLVCRSVCRVAISDEGCVFRNVSSFPPPSLYFPIQAMAYRELGDDTVRSVSSFPSNKRQAPKLRPKRHVLPRSCTQQKQSAQ